LRLGMQSLSSGAVGDYRSMLASASGPPHSIARPGFFVSGVSIAADESVLTVSGAARVEHGRGRPRC
jgi:hypothetical protein